MVIGPGALLAQKPDAQKDPSMESQKIISNLQAFDALETFVTEQSKLKPKTWVGIFDRVRGARRWLKENPQTPGFGSIEFKGRRDTLTYVAACPLQEAIESPLVYGETSKLPLNADVWVMHFANLLHGGYSAYIDAHTGRVLAIIREIEG